MEQQPKKPKFTRREALIGAAAFSAGILSALGGAAIVERIKEVAEPKPEIGKAESNLVIEWLPATVSRWKPQIEKYGNSYQIDPNLLAIMMTVESGGDPRADSGVAKGLMQVTDPTAGDIAKRYLHNERANYDLLDPETSIEFGAAYMRYLIYRFGNVSQGPSWDETVRLVAAGYNGGPGGALAYQNDKWKGLADYDRQTLNYVRYVNVMWQERHDPLSFAYRHWHDTGNGQALVRNAEKYVMPQ